MMAATTKIENQNDPRSRIEMILSMIALSLIVPAKVGRITPTRLNASDISSVIMDELQTIPAKGVS